MKIKLCLMFWAISCSIEFSNAQSLTENYILTRTYTNDTDTLYLDQIAYL
jgi:hypothetical protein